MILLAFGGIAVFAAGSAIAPFLNSLFQLSAALWLGTAPHHDSGAAARNRTKGSHGSLGQGQDQERQVEPGFQRAACPCEGAAEVLLAISREFGKSLEWLLTGEE